MTDSQRGDLHLENGKRTEKCDNLIYEICSNVKVFWVEYFGKENTSYGFTVWATTEREIVLHYITVLFTIISLCKPQLFCTIYTFIYHYFTLYTTIVLHYITLLFTIISLCKPQFNNYFNARAQNILKCRYGEQYTTSMF